MTIFEKAIAQHIINYRTEIRFKQFLTNMGVPEDAEHGTEYQMRCFIKMVEAKAIPGIGTKDLENCKQYIKFWYAEIEKTI